tara:strand:- start:386 stop:826 length:441 start_codon:yes stop_codon:yes gene_type:complete
MAVVVGIAEVLKAASEQSTKADRVAYLKANSSPALKKILGYTYDPVIEWLLPETPPPYTPLAKEEDAQNVLISSVRKLNIFVNHNDYLNLSALKRETQFIQLLESVDPDDAKLLIAMKNRTMPSFASNITKAVVVEAFPTISKHWT